MIKFKDGRTNTYRATVEMEDGKPVNDGGYVKQLRKLITEMNANSDTKHYVKLHGRGHRHGIKSWEQSLPLPHAEYADVYVYQRYS